MSHTDRDRDLDRAVAQAMARLPRSRRPLSRRDFLRFAGAGAGAAFLAACGVRGTSPPATTGPGTATGTGTATAQPTATLPPKAGALDMANWIAYIDKDHGKSTTLIEFREEHDIDMSYSEVINDNEEFFGQIREPLAQGQSTGWDIIVMTDWMIAKLIRLGYLQTLHHDALPNFEANAADKFRDPVFDPGNAHSVAWAAGITGIGYDRSLTGRELTSVEDLFDPAFAGHVGMFTEMRDTFGLVMLSQGVDPLQATVDDARNAQAKLIEQRDAGIVRSYYGNEYLDQLATGNLWATMAWSGDVFALRVDNPNLEFVIPEEGAMRWSDNMAIPVGAEHPTDAHLFMDYVYRPDVATRITEWVWYESPVRQVPEMIAADAAESGDDILESLAASDTVFPSAEVAASTHPYKVLDEAEEQEWKDLFQQVVQGG
ncbi:MAG: spermidine/putrescine ABC transporter substrate-binding protein [Actinobacteria bacterium]|nr:spermidine/putrescine ABC transporter substrate-binding protein [Actinomycetota bacterium]